MRSDRVTCVDMHSHAQGDDGSRQLLVASDCMESEGKQSPSAKILNVALGCVPAMMAVL